MRRKPIYVLPAILYLILCTVLLTLPGDEFPQESWFSDIQLDKWIHIGMFSVMATVISWGIYKAKGNITKRQIIVIGIGCILYGTGMEFVQKYWVINRSFDIKDIGADSIGSIVGILFSSRMYVKKLTPVETGVATKTNCL